MLKKLLEAAERYVSPLTAASIHKNTVELRGVLNFEELFTEYKCRLSGFSFFYCGLLQLNAASFQAHHNNSGTCWKSQNRQKVEIKGVNQESLQDTHRRLFHQIALPSDTNITGWQSSTNTSNTDSGRT